jgi:hypothetical protein
MDDYENIDMKECDMKRVGLNKSMMSASMIGNRPVPRGAPKKDQPWEEGKRLQRKASQGEDEDTEQFEVHSLAQDGAEDDSNIVERRRNQDENNFLYSVELKGGYYSEIVDFYVGEPRWVKGES